MGACIGASVATATRIVRVSANSDAGDGRVRILIGSKTERQASFYVDRIRQDFPILGLEVYGKPLVYLDNAASAQKPKAVPLGPTIMLDAERCILCSRCVRYCDEITGTVVRVSTPTCGARGDLSALVILSAGTLFFEGCGAGVCADATA